MIGDVRQLPPFSDPSDLEASIAEVNDEENATLPEGHQRALLILWRLQRPEAGAGRVGWSLEEPDDVLDALASEIGIRAGRGDRPPERQLGTLTSALLQSPKHMRHVRDG